MSGGREERRWVVKDLGDGSYVMSINGCGWGTQSEAERMTLAQARKTRKLLAGTLDHVVVCRLISRAEAVARAERKAHEAGTLAGIRWAYEAAEKAAGEFVTDWKKSTADTRDEVVQRMLASVCPCQSKVDDPGPDHVDECPWSDPEYVPPGGMF